jgi:hypothetical protein
MKLFGALLLLGLAGITVDHLTTPVHADEVARASTALATTGNNLKEAASTTVEQVATISKDLDRPDQLPAELQDFARSTQTLTTLRTTLQQDIQDYEIAYNAKLAEFDQERAQITDPDTNRSMTTLRRRTEQDKNDRLNNAKATLDHLNTVLAKGKDLQHAAQCVLIANNLHQHGEDLDTTIQTAKTEANKYAVTTNGLLARISQALAE